MSVMILIGSFGGGGAERAMINFANGLSRRQIPVELVVGRGEGPFSTLVVPDIDVTVLSSGMLAAVARLRKRIVETRPAVVFSSQRSANAASVLSTRWLRNRPRVIAREGSTPSIDERHLHKYQRRYARVLKNVVRHADYIMAASEAAASDCKNYYRLGDNKVGTLYTPLVGEDLYRQSAEPTEHRWFDTDIPIVTTLGRVMPVKDFATLIQAFSIVRQGRACKLLIIGGIDRDTAYFNSLKRLVARLKIENDVEFTGFKANPFPYLVKSDTYVLSSLYEGLPGALVQAMALGCKLVSTDCRSGPREILKAGQFGRLVPVGDSAAMAQAIHDSLEHHYDRNEGPGRVIRFTEDYAIDRLLVLISGLMKQASQI